MNEHTHTDAIYTYIYTCICICTYTVLVYVLHVYTHSRYRMCHQAMVDAQYCSSTEQGIPGTVQCLWFGPSFLLPILFLTDLQTTSNQPVASDYVQPVLLSQEGFLVCWYAKVCCKGCRWTEGGWRIVDSQWFMIIRGHIRGLIQNYVIMLHLSVDSV